MSIVQRILSLSNIIMKLMEYPENGMYNCNNINNRKELSYTCPIWISFFSAVITIVYK